MRSVITWFFLISLVFVLPNVGAQTKIYKVVNEDGSISFSDTPMPGAEEIELKGAVNTMQSMNANQRPPAAQAQDKTEQETYTLSILSPQPEATIRDNNGNVRIASAIQPQIEGSYILNFAGEEYSSKSGAFALTGINRGAHQYSVEFLNNSGKVIASSDTRTLYLHQASAILGPANN
uniref:DUF4124 domain-containing protein n=1 Tax=Ningiella ruwaisensis TaxID=2364274 RepID=UPI0010A03715|nr:DUF4124 domain-containing protein [Ningiella ruwaisensis]